MSNVLSELRSLVKEYNYLVNNISSSKDCIIPCDSDDELIDYSLQMTKFQVIYSILRLREYDH